jgi:hypothetical protein
VVVSTDCLVWNEHPKVVWTALPESSALLLYISTNRFFSLLLLELDRFTIKQLKQYFLAPSNVRYKHCNGRRFSWVLYYSAQDNLGRAQDAQAMLRLYSGILRLYSGSTQALLRHYLGTAQVCSPSAQVKAVATHI